MYMVIFGKDCKETTYMIMKLHATESAFLSKSIPKAKTKLLKVDRYVDK